MALSDYERRVLAEIETELESIAPSRRRHRIPVHSAVVATICVLAVTMVAVAAVWLLPPAAVAATCGLAGIAAGLGFAVDHDRHRY